MPLIFEYEKGKNIAAFNRYKERELELVEASRDLSRKPKHSKLNNLFNKIGRHNPKEISEHVPEIVKNSYIESENKIYKKVQSNSSLIELYNKTSDMSLEDILNEVKKGNNFLSFGKGLVELFDYNTTEKKPINKINKSLNPFNDEPIHTIYTESNGSNSWIGIDDGILKVYTNEFEKVVSNINYKSIKIK